MTEATSIVEDRPAHQVVPRDERGRYLPGSSGSAATQFQPGESGNPEGRPAAGASIIEWVNIMDQQGWTHQQLVYTATDPMAPPAKRTAARRWLAAYSETDEREAREAAGFIVNYTHGMPKKSLQISEEPAMTPAQLVVELRKRMGLDENLKPLEAGQSPPKALPAPPPGDQAEQPVGSIKAEGTGLACEGDRDDLTDPAIPSHH